MKLAVIKIGARIFDGGTSGGSGEAKRIIDILSKNNDVHYYTKILKKDKAIENATPHDLLNVDINTEFNNYDALIVINGSFNLFGGAENELFLKNFITINKFNGPVFYMYCDPELALQGDVYKSVKNKDWGFKYKESDLNITRDDIIYIHQPYNIEPFKKKIEKNIKVKKYKFFPFYKFPLLDERLPYDENIIVADFGYGGTLRNNKREKKIIQFLFGLPYKTVLFGNFKKNKFKYTKDIKENEWPELEQAVEYSEFLNKMNTFRATVTIGDKMYQGNNLNQRIYESILANNICFIDKELDPEMRVFKNNELRELLYIDSKDDLIKKYQNIKDNNLFKEICDLQYNDVKIDINEYCLELSNLIKEEL